MDTHNDPFSKSCYFLSQGSPCKLRYACDNILNNNIDELKIGNFKMGIGIAEKATKQEGIAGVVM